jgi:hypothetical protein
LSSEKRRKIRTAESVGGFLRNPRVERQTAPPNENPANPAIADPSGELSVGPFCRKEPRAQLLVQAGRQHVRHIPWTTARLLFSAAVSMAGHARQARPTLFASTSSTNGRSTIWSSNARQGGEASFVRELKNNVQTHLGPNSNDGNHAHPTPQLLIVWPRLSIIGLGVRLRGGFRAAPKALPPFSCAAAWGRLPNCRSVDGFLRNPRVERRRARPIFQSPVNNGFPGTCSPHCVLRRVWPSHGRRNHAPRVRI